MLDVKPKNIHIPLNYLITESENAVHTTKVLITSHTQYYQNVMHFNYTLLAN